MPIHHQPPTAIAATMGEVRPTQTVWTGASWDYVIDVSTEDSWSDTVTIVRRTPARLRFTTTYRRHRPTAVRLPADHDLTTTDPRNHTDQRKAAVRPPLVSAA